MKIVSVAVKDIKPNPFKKEINGGKLHEELVERYVESIQHGTLPEIFTVRVKEGAYELCFGHHRLKALERVNGSAYLVSCNVVKFTDEMMLIDMVRENLTQRVGEFREEVESVQLVRKYLEKDRSPDSGDLSKDVLGRKKHQDRSEGVGASQIAKFLSKDGKMICSSKVGTLLRIIDNLDPELLEEVKRADHTTIAQGIEERDFITIYQADVLSRFKGEEQHRLAEVFKKEPIDNRVLRKLVNVYENAPHEVKEAVLSREVKLADIDEAVLNAIPSSDGDVPQFKREVLVPSIDALISKLNKNIIDLYEDIEEVNRKLGAVKWDKAQVSFNNKQKFKIHTFLSETKRRATSLLDTIERVNKLLEE